MTFDVDPDLFRHDNFPNFREPTEVGYFSVDNKRSMVGDCRNARFYCAPSMEVIDCGRRYKLANHFDLSDGYEVAVHKKNGCSEKLDVLLRYIVANRQKLQPRDVRSMGRRNDVRDQGASPPAFEFHPNFVCYRGLLTKLICTPYEKNSDWIFCATRFHGTIYLCAFDTESDITRRASQSEREKLMSYWGFKFEQYVTSDEPGGVPDTNKPIDENEEYCSVSTTKLDDHRLFFGAEVDCIKSEQRNSRSTSRYIELKTNREITTTGQYVNFRRFKLLKWWAQSFAIGIRSIVCGFRDDNGYVSALETFDVNDLPKLSEGYWDPCICFNFLKMFLSFIEQCVSEDDPSIVFKFEWKGVGSAIQCTRLTGKHDYQILPGWYLRNF